MRGVRARARLVRRQARRATRLVAAGAALLALGIAIGWIAGVITTAPEPTPLPAPPVAAARPLAPAEPQYDAPLPAAPRAAPGVGELETARLALPPVPAPPAARGRIALVIDDLGLFDQTTRQAIALDRAVTLAFLPYGPDTAAYARAAAAAGHEVLLHMPMEPLGQDDPGPGALMTALPPAEIRARLDAAFAKVPGAIGLNNHMGSQFTRDADAMAVVLDEIRRRGMMILDSVTTPDSVVVELARGLGVPSGARDVFLDNDRDPTAIERQLERVREIAGTAGVVVAIGHPYEETIAAMPRWMAELRRQGFAFVPVSAVALPRLAEGAVAEHASPPDDR